MATRLMSYLTSQAFLVSAFAISMGNMNPVWGATYRLVFPLMLVLLGMALSIQAGPGIKGSCEVIFAWHVRQDALMAEFPQLTDIYGPERGAITEMHQRSLWFPIAAPWTFVTAWVFFAALAIWLGSK